MSLELLYNCEKERIRRREDAVVCCLHCYLIKNGLKCIGNGEEIVDPQTVRTSDMLPGGWNDGGDIYIMTYRQDTTLDTYLMKALNIDGVLYIQLLRHHDEKITEIEIVCADFTTPDFKTSFDSAYKKLFDLETRVKKELLAPFLTSTKAQEANKSQETPLNRDMRDPLRVYDERVPHNPYAANYRDEHTNPLLIGQNDLDPLHISGGASGGMIFDPLRSYPGGHRQPNYGGGGFGGSGFGGPNMIPRGSVPPGARFDPISPDLGFGGEFDPRRAGPDPDHLPPPGYNDMFM